MSKHITLEYSGGKVNLKRKIQIDDVRGDDSLDGIWLTITYDYGDGNDGMDGMIDALLTEQEFSEFIQVLTVVLNHKKEGT